MAQRRGNGDASIYKDGNRWRGSVEVGRSPEGLRQRKKVSGRSRAEVLAKIREVQQEAAAGAAPKNDRLTLASFLERWLTVTLPGSIADSTLDNYSDTVRLHIKPALGHHVLSRLTVTQVDEFLAAKRSAGYSPNSIRLMRTILRRALNAAEREGLVSRNVAGLSIAPRLNRAPGRSLTVEQARALLNEASRHRLEALFLLMLAFGLRRGEALGLAWAELDWVRATLKVTHGVKRVKVRSPAGERKTVVIVGELKTARARRTLYLSPALLAALARHQVRQEAERRILGTDWVETGLIFTTEGGTVLDPDNLSHLFSRMAERAGLGHWHAHELRHSGASLMLAGGTPLHVVSEVLGHASIAVTKDVYGHLVEGDKRSAAETITAILMPPTRSDE